VRARRIEVGTVPYCIAAFQVIRSLHYTGIERKVVLFTALCYSTVFDAGRPATFDDAIDLAMQFGKDIATARFKLLRCEFTHLNPATAATVRTNSSRSICTNTFL
jgi:hypothetical protein